MELLNPGLELFGAMGVDFPSDTESLFSDRLHGALDCELSKDIASLLDIQQNWDERPPSEAGAENDSVFSDDSFKDRAPPGLFLATVTQFLRSEATLQIFRGLVPKKLP